MDWERPFRKIEEKLQKEKEERERKAKEQEEVIQKMKSASSCINFKGVLESFVKVLPLGARWREDNHGLRFEIDSGRDDWRIRVDICLKRVPEWSEHYATVGRSYQIPLRAVTEKNLYVQVQKGWNLSDGYSDKLTINIPLKTITEEKLASALVEAYMA